MGLRKFRPAYTNDLNWILLKKHSVIEILIGYWTKNFFPKVNEMIDVNISKFYFNQKVDGVCYLT